MSYSLLKVQVDTAPRYPIKLMGPTCSAGPVSAVAHVPSLAQCPYHESGGARCELEHHHEGGHAFTDAIFIFLQARYGELHGPRCRTRRGPSEYIYKEGPMCL